MVETLTEEQLDAAARMLCELRGDRPDDMSFSYSVGAVSALTLAEREIEQFHEVMIAYLSAIEGGHAG